MMMVALHQYCQRIQKGFRSVERIYVQLRMVLSALVVGIKHYRGDVPVMPFGADTASIQHRDGVAD